MVMLKRSIFCVLFLLLSASCFSNARLHPSGGAEVNVIPVSVVNTSKVMGDQVEIEGNKKSGKENVRKYVKKKRSLRSRLGGEIVDGGFVAFTADYHSPRHHPPKNNK
ncbi:hypothetical protein AAHE18_01G061100 [Arachis hypogaea]